jgi:DNA-binding response OmpR family regulator
MGTVKERPARRLLVLDDEPLNRAFVESVVAAEGFHVTLTDDPREAVLWASENPTGLVLADILLGTLEAVPRWRRRRGDPVGVAKEVAPPAGYALLRPAEASPEMGRYPLVHFRDPNHAENGEDPLRFAVIGYVPEPLEAETLLAQLAGAFGAVPEAQAAAATAVSSPTPGFDLLPGALRVALLVDNDVGFREELRTLLEASGFTVHEAADGADGLRIARLRRPWLILTEVNLPDIDGFELCRQVRAHSLLRHTPLVFLSNWDSYGDRYHGLSHGADDFFSKETPFNELLVRLQILLRRYSDLRARTRADSSIEGGLEPIGATGLLQMCHVGRFTGTCTVRSGAVWVQFQMRDGEILNARSPSVSGEDAVFELLAWTRGRFEFVPDDPGPGQPIARFDYLLLEGCRRLDEMGRMADPTPGWGAVDDSLTARGTS